MKTKTIKTMTSTTAGNISKFKALLGPGKDVDAKEFTITQWRGSAFDCIIMSILLDYETSNTCLMLDHSTYKLGLSYYGHPQQENIF